MYAEVTSVQLRRGHTERGLELWRDAIAPFFKRHAGFRELLVVGDRGTDRGMAIVLWESREAFQAAADDPEHRAVFGRMAPWLAAPTQRETFEVLLQERS